MIDNYLNKIICGDCIDVMQKMPEESVDLIITSPPYNLKNSTGNGMKDGRGGKLANAHGDIWQFSQVMNNTHPAPFPVHLIKRIVTTIEAEIILDPFMGSGTTAIAA